MLFATIGFAKAGTGLKVWPEDWHCSNMSEEARKVTIDAFFIYGNFQY